MKIVKCINNIHTITHEKNALEIGREYEVYGEGKAVYYVYANGKKMGYSKIYFKVVD